MQRSPLLVEYRAVCDVLGEGMLEEIFGFRKGRLFIEKLFGLEG